jgi:hypothetical protein
MSFSGHLKMLLGSMAPRKVYGIAHEIAIEVLPWNWSVVFFIHRKLRRPAARPWRRQSLCEGAGTVVWMSRGVVVIACQTCGGGAIACLAGDVCVGKIAAAASKLLTGLAPLHALLGLNGKMPSRPAL